MGERMLWGVKNGDLEVVKEIAEAEGFSVNKELLNGRNALHYAADYGQADVVEYLIVKGADVNLPDKFGITALLAAVYEGHIDCVRILTANGAQKNGKSPDGQSYSNCTDDKEIQELLK